MQPDRGEHMRDGGDFRSVRESDREPPPAQHRARVLRGARARAEPRRRRRRARRHRVQDLKRVTYDTYTFVLGTSSSPSTFSLGARVL